MTARTNDAELSARAENRPFRSAIVTGAGKGLGAAFAKALGAAGAGVVVNNRRRPDDQPPSADRVAGELKRAGVEAVAEYSDVADGGAAARLVGTAVDAFGGLDALVCNAGVSGEAALFENAPASSFEDVMTVNFSANIRLVAEALPYLKQSPAGRIVFVSSSAGLHGARGLAAYAASKGALNAFALTLADELKRYDIGVNVLCPFASTRMTGDAVKGPHTDLLAPEYAAPAAAWLAGPTCAATGQIWVACAGQIRRAQVFDSAPVGPDAPAALTPEWIEQHANGWSSPDGFNGFRGAQDAFADIFKSAVAARERLSR